MIRPCVSGRIVVVALAFSGTACGTRSTTDPTESSGTSAIPAPAILADLSTARTVDDQFALAGKYISGFAGAYITDAGQLVMLLAGDADGDRAKSILAAFSGWSTLTASSIQVEPARYGYSTLRRMYDSLRRRLSGPALVGATVHKMGSTSGWTTSRITATCADRDVAGTNIRLLCQYRTDDTTSSNGDSGSPLFRPYGPDPAIELLGIVCGSNSQGTSISEITFVGSEIGGNLCFGSFCFF